jgi:hypothetical protein
MSQFCPVFTESFGLLPASGFQLFFDGLPNLLEAVCQPIRDLLPEIALGLLQS